MPSLRSQDLIGQAQTGDRRRRAFGLPMLNKLNKNQSAIRLVVAPTRELAIQVQEGLYLSLGKPMCQIDTNHYHLTTWYVQC